MELYISNEKNELKKKKEMWTVGTVLDYWKTTIL